MKILVYCKTCRERCAPIHEKCDHCGEFFTISTNTQIWCAQNSFSLPRKCADCRDLFRHKPFRTVREEFLGNIVWRTYNDLGDLISETRNEEFLGDRFRRHTSETGKTTGITRNHEFLGRKYRETTRPGGSVKSRSYREEYLGEKYSRSVGGTSRTVHTKRAEDSLGRGKHQRTA